MPSEAHEQLVLSLLSESGEDFVPAEVLTDKLGLSKAAFFRVLEALRAKGFRIETSRAGYRVSDYPDRLDASVLKPLIGTHDLGRWLECLEETASTSELAWQRAQEGAPHGHLVIADRQTRGRGRLGRTWASPPKTNLYLSLVLRPSLRPARAPELPLVAAVAVAEALQQIGCPARIKWPNDLEIGGRKLAGILTELCAETDRVLFVILGIGVNLNVLVEELPEDLRATATSVRAACGIKVSRPRFAATLLEKLEAWLDVHEDEGFQPVRARWTELSSTVGATVKVTLEGKEIVGQATGIDDSGALIVKTASGEERVIAGTVQSVRREAGVEA